jgi:protein-export membrane protein SecD
MLHFSRAYTIAILAICLLGLLIPIPNFFSKASYDALPSFAQHKIGLGLDLRGGAYILTSMDMDELKKKWFDNITDQVREKLRKEAKVGYSSIGASANGVSVRLAKPEDMDAALKAIRPIAQPGLGFGAAPDLDIKSDAATGTITITPTEAAIRERVTQAIATAVEILRIRLDPAGTKEFAIQRQGNDRILVQAPGVESDADLKSIEALIKAGGSLTFHLLHPSMSAEEVAQAGGKAPAGFDLLPSSEHPGVSYLIDKRILVDGSDLADAQPGFDSTHTNEPIVNFRFNQRGAAKFGKITQDNVGRPFAMVLDKKVISAPVIREPILGGTGQISGNFTPESANQLAVLLRSGALPAGLNVVEERVVGASLGQDSIDAGKRAALIGMLGVAAFMIFAYGTFGVFAVIGAALHVVLVIAIMTLLGSTMTLPGIAGVVLTIGMAVDANVLIYERIREELRNGKTPISAIDAGFSRAYATIVDSQMTTFTAGLLMFLLGAGPIRGFAVTLTLGILTTVFTAFTVTRLLAAWWLAAQKTRKIEAPL